MKKFITHIGMDTDSREFDIAIAEGASGPQLRLRFAGSNPLFVRASDYKYASDSSASCNTEPINP